ncbi:hypothetical protein GGI42DRAFT_290411 [Trichoderma sp. SZMC 28013]
MIFSLLACLLVRLIKGSGSGGMQARRDMERQIAVCDVLRTCIVCRRVPFEKMGRFDLHSLTLQRQLCSRAPRRITTSISLFPRLLSR